MWVASWRKATRRDPASYSDLVEDAWTRLNRQRVAMLEAQGRMTDAGRRSHG